MSKIRLTTKKMLVGILVTSLVMSISVSESYAEDVIDNTEITENEEQVKADIPADIILSDKEYVLNSDAVEIDGTTSVTDGGILTYQWYKDGEIMENEVDSKIIPDTSVLGEHRYKVIATNTLYDENENIIATASKESNEICVKIINDSDKTDDLDGKEDLDNKENPDNKDDLANKENPDNKDSLDKGDKPDFNDGFGKDKIPGMDKGPGEGAKPGNGKNIGLVDKNIPGMNGKMPNMGKFSGQLQNRGNAKLVQTSSKNSTTTTSEEEEDLIKEGTSALKY